MYRDATTALDERDRAVGAILIGEALIGACERAREVGDTQAPGAWRAIRDAHDDFPEIWRSLDRARHELARRGANVAGYDELRPRARTRLSTAHGDDADAMRMDPAALDDARRAAAELKLALPGADWAAIEQRTSGLVRAPLLRRYRNKLIVAALVVPFAIAAVCLLYVHGRKRYDGQVFAAFIALYALGLLADDLFERRGRSARRGGRSPGSGRSAGRCGNGSDRGGRQRTDQGGRQIRHGNHRALGQKDGALQDVLQFAHITRPLVCLQRRFGRW